MSTNFLSNNREQFTPHDAAEALRILHNGKLNNHDLTEPQTWEGLTRATQAANRPEFQGLVGIQMVCSLPEQSLFEKALIKLHLKKPKPNLADSMEFVVGGVKTKQEALVAHNLVSSRKLGIQNLRDVLRK